ncbi:MAG: hypothetical protein ACJAZO_001311 [Myxococcota bacterium]|jgi:hypothetical protein
MSRASCPVRSDNNDRPTLGQFALKVRYQDVKYTQSVDLRIMLSSGAEMDVAVGIRDSGIVLHNGDGVRSGHFHATKQDQSWVPQLDRRTNPGQFSSYTL